jgi:hypothetical protein
MYTHILLVSTVTTWMSVPCLPASLGFHGNYVNGCALPARVFGHSIILSDTKAVMTQSHIERSNCCDDNVYIWWEWVIDNCKLGYFHDDIIKMHPAIICTKNNTDFSRFCVCYAGIVITGFQHSTWVIQGLPWLPLLPCSLYVTRWGRRNSCPSSVQYNIAEPDGSTLITVRSPWGRPWRSAWL